MLGICDTSGSGIIGIVSVYKDAATFSGGGALAAPALIWPTARARKRHGPICRRSFRAMR
jgi:hypothetical protein